MISRGFAFAGSAILLKRASGNAYVWRHNLCQAIELLGKGVLLLHDFDTTWPVLRAKYGHRLLTICDEAAAIAGVRTVSGELRDELTALTAMYESHQLRYASGRALLIEPETMPASCTLSRVAAAMRILNRERAKELAFGSALPNER